MEKRQNPKRNLEKSCCIYLTGEGIGNHPDLSGRIDAFYDFLHGERNAYDDSGHGTHVAGCIGGSGKASGGMYRSEERRVGKECRL